MAVEEKLFVRKATGLVREIGAVTAIIIVIANTVGLGWQKRVFQFTGVASLPENQFLAGIPPMAMAFILGGIAILLSVVAIAVLTAAMPRSGGGYVAISRIISPFWGFVGAWLEFFSIAWSFGIIAVAVFEGIYGIIGPVVFGPSFLSSYPVDYWLLAGGIILVLVFTIIGTFGVKMTGLLLQVMFWVPAVLTFYVFGLLGSATGSSVTTGMANIFGAGVTPSKYVTSALNPPTSGVTFDAITAHLAPSYWAAVGTALIGAYFAYIGYAASTFVAGEVKEANRNLPRTLLASSILIVALYVSVSLFASRAIAGLAVTSDGKFSLLSAWSYLSYGCKTGTPTSCLDAAGLPPVKLWTTTVAGLSASGIGFGSANVLLFLFGVLWIANDIPPFILTASRVLFAMSFDRVLPAAFSNVNDRFHSPINAVIATGIVGIIGCFSESTIFDGGGTLNAGSNGFLSAVLGSSGGVELTDLFDALFFTLFTLALFILPLRNSRKQIFDTAPYKPGGKTGMMTLGLAGLAANLFIDGELLFATQGDFNLGGQNWASPTLLVDQWALWFTIILGVVGGLIYFYYKRISRANYATIFAQIPPE